MVFPVVLNHGLAGSTLSSFDFTWKWLRENYTAGPYAQQGDKSSRKEISEKIPREYLLRFNCFQMPSAGKRPESGVCM